MLQRYEIIGKDRNNLKVFLQNEDFFLFCIGEILCSQFVDMCSEFANMCFEFANLCSEIANIKFIS